MCREQELHLEVPEDPMSAAIPDEPLQLDLAIQGMTCAACSARIERVLGKLEGVREASVNLATERARVRFLPGFAMVGWRDAAIEAVVRAGYGATVLGPQSQEQDAALRMAREHEQAVALRHLVIAIVLSLPLAAPMIASASGHGFMLAPSWQWVLATPVQFWIGARFYSGAWKSVRGGAANMDVLVVLGTTSAYGLSCFLMLGSHGEHAMPHLYFEASTMVVTLVLLGKWLEERARRHTTDAIRALQKLQPLQASVRRTVQGVEQEVTVAIADLGIGDVVVARPGERIAADGTVMSANGSVDESMLTGESVPVAKQEGASVAGGAINGDGLLVFRVTALGAESRLARITRMVEQAQVAKPPIQRLVDRVSAVFVPVVVVIAMITFGTWFLMRHDAQQALLNAVAVLVIACPCALGLATPAAMMVGTGVAARFGILIQDVSALEAAHSVRTVIFDKTGTLTQGRPVLIESVLAQPGESPDAILALAAAVQMGSEHALAQAILEASQQLRLPSATEHLALPGRGIQAKIDGQTVWVGNRRLMDDLEVDCGALRAQADAFEARGQTLAWLATQHGTHKDLRALLAFGDALRPQAKGVVARLQAMGLRVVMLTGDNAGAAQRVAGAVGIVEVHANMLPEDKARFVADLAKQGDVAMVGDGVNDAPALAAANVGIAMSEGAEVALHAAGITLMRSDPALVAEAISISKRTWRKIQQNLFWAFAYNLIGLPLAAAGLLNPVFAGAAMALSSVSVVSNALLLARWRPEAATRSIVET
jgi:Cu+-exporting ATPase